MVCRLLAATAVAALLLTSAACGSENDDTTAEDSSSSSPSQDASTPTDGETPDSGGDSATECDYVSDGSGGSTGDVTPPPETTEVSGTVKVTMQTSVGDLEADLDADAAPCTVASFVSLASQGFFDKTTCHRLTLAKSGISVLQCGDPTGTGTGGPGYTVPDELTGKETYGPGTLAMANTGAPDSGGSQFFIVYADSALPPSYTVFGQVSDTSVDLIEDVAAQGVVGGGVDGAPKEPVDISSVVVK